MNICVCINGRDPSYANDCGADLLMDISYEVVVKIQLDVKKSTVLDLFQNRRQNANACQSH